MRIIQLLGIAVLVAGCASGAQRPPLLHDVLQTGDRLSFTGAVERQPTWRSVYFQGGEARSWWGADSWRTQCRLVLDEGVRSSALPGSEYEVRSIRRISTTATESAEALSTSILLRTVKGAPASELRCERWRDYLTMGDTPSDISLADFEDAVGDYIEVLPRG
jgi:hypothetical protein